MLQATGPAKALRANQQIQTAGYNVLGQAGATIFALLVSAACLGSININVFTTARLTISAVNKGYLPRPLLEDRYHSDEGERDLSEESRSRRIQRRDGPSSCVLGAFGEGPFWQTPM